MSFLSKLDSISPASIRQRRYKCHSYATLTALHLLHTDDENGRIHHALHRKTTAQCCADPQVLPPPAPVLAKSLGWQTQVDPRRLNKVPGIQIGQIFGQGRTPSTEAGW